MQTYNGKKGIVPALQSRIAIRGNMIRNMEQVFREHKHIAKLTGVPQVWESVKSIRADIKVQADDQKLDRALMRRICYW